MSDAVAELEAMKKVAEALEGLESEARSRVLTWAAGHYAVGQVKQRSEGFLGRDRSSDLGKNEDQFFETIGDLFAAAQPGSDAEKALVAGYWLQVVQGSSGFGTQEINRELKHLGYGIGNITRAFEILKKTRPQQGIQLRKAGATKQARKTVKLTDAGIRVVETMARNRGSED